jgi:hypothetical protein
MTICSIITNFFFFSFLEINGESYGSESSLVGLLETTSKHSQRMSKEYNSTKPQDECLGTRSLIIKHSPYPISKGQQYTIF